MKFLIVYQNNSIFAYVTYYLNFIPINQVGLLIKLKKSYYKQRFVVFFQLYRWLVLLLKSNGHTYSFLGTLFLGWLTYINCITFFITLN